jgi:hypothetical protein
MLTGIFLACRTWAATGGTPAAMLQPLQRALTAARLPVLARHGISLRGHTVLSAPDASPARSRPH